MITGLATQVTKRSSLFHLAGLTLILSLSLLGQAFGTTEQKPVPPTCNMTEAEAAGLNGDTSTDIEAMRNYQHTVAEMLKEEKFEQLDCLADHLRATKQRFSGGMWKLHAFYAGLYTPVAPQQHATEEDWKALLERLQKWSSARPQSLTALVALAWTYESYAWDARGQGYTNTVSESGWKLFEERYGEARQIADKAAAFPTKCPEWYLLMFALGRDEGWSVSQMRTLYEEATKFEPGYYYFARMLAFYLLPRWSGETGDSEQFTEEAANRIGGDAGDILYFQIANFTLCSCEDDNPHLSWERIVKGFQAAEREYGGSMLNLNLIAHMATFVSGSDPVIADQAITRIGDQWDYDEWTTKENFESAKKWAAAAAPIVTRHRAIETAAQDNLKAPEGIAYKTAFEKKYRELVQECIASAGESHDKFKTLTKVGAGGTVEDIMIYWKGSAAACVYQKLHAFYQDKAAAFPPPPHDEYWVQLDLDASEFSPGGSN